MGNISVFDLIVTILLAATTLWGGVRGVVSQISSIATWVLSGLAAARFGFVVGKIVSIPEPWRAPISAAIVFGVSLLALNLATRFVKRAVSLSGLKEFDRQVGALFGFFKGCAICVVLTFFCVLTAEKTRDLVEESKTGPYLASVALLLKSAFPESETMTRFEAHVATMGTGAKDGAETPSLDSDIVDLERYLKDAVLSQEAADVVEEAESGAARRGGSSGWSRFLNDLRGGSKARESGADWERDAEAVFRNDASEEERENGREREEWDVWDEWELWESGDDEARGGAVNGGYYGEYEENVGEAKYDDYADRESGGAKASSGWSDLATFLTNITSGARSTSASGERRAANYGAAPSESLNDFLGLPSNGNARNASPTVDASVPRTTDGAILGRPNTTSTTLIPPLPY